MQFNEIERGLFSEHRANNSVFYRVLFGLGALISPVVLLLIPLPGYWALSLPILDSRFVLALVLFIVLVLGLLKLHAAVVHQRYFCWAMDTFGVWQFQHLYCKSQLKFCTPVFILLVSGFVHAPFSTNTVLRCVLLLVLLSTFIVLLSVRYLQGKTNFSIVILHLPIDFKFVYLSLTRIALRLIVCCCVSLTMTMLLLGSHNLLFDMGALVIGYIMLVPLIIACTHFIWHEFKVYTLFFQSVSVQYYQHQKFIFITTISLVWLSFLLPALFFLG